MQTRNGIERVEIIGSLGGSRELLARSARSNADRYYYDAFAEKKSPLCDRLVMTHHAEIGSKIANFDKEHGCDLVLNLAIGQVRLKLQEKILSYTQELTMTFEEEKNSGLPGGYYYSKADLHACLYCLRWREHHDPTIHQGMIVDLERIRNAKINWRFNKNTTEGCRQKFRYIPFDLVPKDCVVYRGIPTPATMPA